MPPRREERTALDRVLAVFLPNRAVSGFVLALLGLGELGLALLWWTVRTLPGRHDIWPTPIDVLRALPRLWFTQGLGHELATSFSLNLAALAWSSLLALGLA